MPMADLDLIRSINTSVASADTITATLRDARSYRAIHVIATLHPAGGGPSYSVPRLCEALAAAGTDTSLFSVTDDAVEHTDAMVNGYRDRRFTWDYESVPIVRDLRLSRELAWALRAETPAADVVHNHGIWLMPNLAAGRAAMRSGKPFVVSTRGMLAPAALAFSSSKKQMFWRLLQGAQIHSAACLHATSDQEYEELRAFGLTNPIAMIPNGMDVPDLAKPIEAPPKRLVLWLGRIHPKKGLDSLIHAWARIAPKHPDWQLRVVGPAEDAHDKELIALAGALGLSRISIEGPIYGEAKTDILRAADLFVLPSLNENFGLTVAEALAAGTPVISSKGAPWARLAEEECGWWIDHGVEPLVAAMDRAMVMPSRALKEMGAKGRAWMARDFSWDSVASDMIAVYRWLAQESDAPAVVRFSETSQRAKPRVKVSSVPAAPPDAPMRDLVTPVIITYNEAPNIERTLEKLTWANRIVVVDSGSTDGTLEILGRYPQVATFHRDFTDFAAQWDFALSQAKTPWVLSLDADYELSYSILQEILVLKPGDDVSGYAAQFIYRIDGRALRGTLYPKRIVLFRAANAFHQMEGHTQRVIVEGKIAMLNARIYHDDRKPLSRWMQSQQRYALDEVDHLLKMSRQNLDLADKIRLMGWPAPLGIFFYVLFLKGCILDGWPGWFYAMQRMIAEMLVALEVIRRRKGRGFLGS